MLFGGPSTLFRLLIPGSVALSHHSYCGRTSTMDISNRLPRLKMSKRCCRPTEFLVDLIRSARIKNWIDSISYAFSVPWGLWAYLCTLTSTSHLWLYFPSVLRWESPKVKCLERTVRSPNIPCVASSIIWSAPRGTPKKEQPGLLDRNATLRVEDWGPLYDMWFPKTRKRSTVTL